MDVIMVAGLALVAAAFGITLKRHVPEFSMMLSVLTGVLLLGLAISAGAPIFERIQTLFEAAGAQAEMVGVLFKALGICFVVQIASDACRDMGESAIASKAELAGKFAVLLVSMPLFEQIMAIVGSLVT